MKMDAVAQANETAAPTMNSTPANTVDESAATVAGVPAQIPFDEGQAPLSTVVSTTTVTEAIKQLSSKLLDPTFSNSDTLSGSLIKFIPW